MSKKSVKTTRHVPIAEPPFVFSRLHLQAAYLAICLSASITAWVYLSASVEQIGEFSFPLDDGWIHLQFAKIIGQHFRYAYFETGKLVAGSTSPLYTFLLSLFFIVSKSPNEFWISYLIGVASFAAGGIFIFEIARRLWPQSPVYPVLATLFYIVDSRLVWASLSGMETTLFITVLLACALLVIMRKPLAAGILAGLSLWGRPEGLAAGGLLSVIVLLNEKFSRTEKIKFIASVSVLFGLYFGMHLAINGTLLPNTYAAKLEYYQNGSGTAAKFLSDVAIYFSDGITLKVLLVFFAIGLILIAVKTIKTKRLGIESFFAAFAFAVVAAYAVKLPYLYQNGRYVMPVIPFFYLVSVLGLAVLIEDVLPRSASVKMLRLSSGLFGVVLVLASAFKVVKDEPIYTEYSQHIAERHIAAGKYLATHTTPQDIIATHDIGAIAFYSDRNVLDMVGLVSKEMLGKIAKPDLTKKFIIESGATKLACLQSWFEVTGLTPEATFAQGSPDKEIMDIYDITSPESRRTLHFMSKDAAYFKDGGLYYLQRGDFKNGEAMLSRAIFADPNADKPYIYLAMLKLSQRDTAAAVRLYEKVLTLSPTNLPATTALEQLRGNTATSGGQK
jgi:tetratricopeptide (TPR) repeat protein